MKQMLAGVVVILMLGASLAAAQDKTTQTATKAEVAAMLKQAQLGLEDAVHRALTKKPGQAVQVQLHQIKQKLAWQVTILAGGHLEDIYVDVQDGSFLTAVSPTHGESGQR
jgi:uncharacterized protein YpmB